MQTDNAEQLKNHLYFIVRHISWFNAVRLMNGIAFPIHIHGR
jgi:hypothetical protein